MIGRFNTSKFFSGEIFTHPAGRLGEEMCPPAAEFMCPGLSGTWLFQTLLGEHAYSEFTLTVKWFLFPEVWKLVIISWDVMNLVCLSPAICYDCIDCLIFWFMHFVFVVNNFILSVCNLFHFYMNFMVKWGDNFHCWKIFCSSLIFVLMIVFQHEAIPGKVYDQ
jgi:hypothetical protein